jgi:hypothetical protein
MIKRTWTYVSNNALLAAIIGGLVVLALGTWRWSDVKALLADVGAWFVDVGVWLFGTTEVYRVVMLADFLVLAALLAWVGLWWSRGRASSVPVVAPVAAPAPSGGAHKHTEGNPKVADGFEPNRIQMVAASVLCECYPQKLQLPDLAAAMQTLTHSLVRVAPQAEIARQMEDMLVNGVAVIVEPDSQTAYYGLTRNGRNFMLAEMGKPGRRT